MSKLHAPLIIDDSLDEYLEHDVRNRFVRRVYGILAVQLLFTFLVALPFQLVEMQIYVIQNPLVLYGSAGFGIVFSLLLICVPSLARTKPTNIVMLAVFTICEAFVIGCISAVSRSGSPLVALVMVLITVVVLCCYTFSEACDFTGQKPYSIAICSVLFCFGIFYFANRSLTMTAWSAFAALVFSSFLVFDMQLICSGKGRLHRIRIDEYVFAVTSLYLDVVNLFVFVFTFLSHDDD